MASAFNTCATRRTFFTAPTCRIRLAAATAFIANSIDTNTSDSTWHTADLQLVTSQTKGARCTSLARWTNSPCSALNALCPVFVGCTPRGAHLAATIYTSRGRRTVCTYCSICQLQSVPPRHTASAVRYECPQRRLQTRTGKADVNIRTTSSWWRWYEQTLQHSRVAVKLSCIFANPTVVRLCCRVTTCRN